MKRTILFTLILLSIPSWGISQNVMDADVVSSMHEDRIAIKKGNQWAFMDAEGQIAINYRDDLVPTKTEDGNYPLFKNGRCLIIEKKDGISYFGYIDTMGKTVIEPQYLNAGNFKDQRAIVLLLERTELTTNIALKKPVVSYDYFEVIIDGNGKVLTYLNKEPTHVTLSADHLRNPPALNSKFISKNLVAVMTKEKKWTVIKID